MLPGPTRSLQNSEKPMCDLDTGPQASSILASRRGGGGLEFREGLRFGLEGLGIRSRAVWEDFMSC